MKFRVKTNEVIEAFQWMGHDYDKPEHPIVRYFRHPGIPGESICDKCNVRMHDHGWIDGARNEGLAFTVCPKDWIIDTIIRHKFPLKPTDFEKKYDYIEETMQDWRDNIPYHEEELAQQLKHLAAEESHGFDWTTVDFLIGSAYGTMRWNVHPDMAKMVAQSHARQILRVLHELFKSRPELDPTPHIESIRKMTGADKPS